MKNNLEQILNCLREANAEGMIVDTIWMDDDQTLFDFIELCIEEAALARQQEAEPVDDGAMFDWIDARARETFSRHKSVARGQQITAADNPESHLIWAALKWAEAHPPKPAALPARCEYCNGSGDVHSFDGEWLGSCTECLPAAQPQVPGYIAAAEKAILSACNAAVERLNELAPDHGWDSGEVVADMYIRPLRAMISAAKEGGK